jgi:CO/xanthine dehydrogenase FAD-binding subunit
MDQNTIEELVVPNPSAPGDCWREGDAWLAGGTFLHSLPLPHLKRFIDLSRLEWPAIQTVDGGLEIGPTCTVKQLLDFQPPPQWSAGALLHDCVRSFLAGFKVWNSATVLGNICTSIPAGPMTTMACALEASYTLWATDGSVRVVPAIEFVTGNNENILAPGELLRKVEISGRALNRRYAMRRFALTQAGRSSIFLVGTRDPNGEVLITVSAATSFPVHVRFPEAPTAEQITAELDAQIPDELYFDDPNGRPDHRKHMTYLFAEQIRAELAAA